MIKALVGVSSSSTSSDAIKEILDLLRDLRGSIEE
jgi:hypothetical protein